MHQDNTPLEEWLVIWLLHEVERIYESKGHKKFEYTGMTIQQRRDRGLPTNREQAIAYIKEHRANNPDHS